MGDPRTPPIRSLLPVIAILLSLGLGYVDSHAQGAAEGKATFYVY